MKKLVALVTTLALLACSLLGCAAPAAPAAAGAAPADAAAPAADGDVEITWMFWDDLEATTDLITIGYREVIERFNAADNGYHCNVITSNLEEYDTKLNALIAGGQTPDIWICNPGPNHAQYVNAGVAMDLTDILQNQNADWYKTFSGGMFDRLIYDGKIYAVPTCFAAACCYYNTEIFKECGVEVPKTFDELLAVCEAIEAKGYTAITCSAGTAWCLSMVAGYLCDRNGGPDNLTSVINGTGKWTDASFVNAATQLHTLSKHFQPTAAADNNDECTQQFYSGKAAMLIQGSWAIGQMNGAEPGFEDKCGVFQFPAVEGGSDPNRLIVKTDNLVVSAKTPHIDAVVELMKYFTDTTAQTYIAEVGGKMPVTNNVTIDFEKAPKQLKFVTDIVANMTGSLGFYNESLPTVEAGTQFDNTMVSVFLEQTTPEDGLAQLQTWWDDNMK